ncbi:MAG: hypothetical protein COT15_04985 [Candidatus Diapherotrites archaeon CG08_land_8_20_14_0_20_34_12]|nr:MAG: hypothetical protein COT15_04985 [Candidatus Diapherotrites archaeon CG08_land_8_20_14_0_20_34_12]
MEFWNDIVTERSWQVLQDFRRKFNFVLIGGWAAYLYAKTNKSKDIDLIVDFNELEKIRNNYALKKNVKLNKYEIIIDEIDIDIYVPYYSKFIIPAEDLIKQVNHVQGFKVLKPEYLILLKQQAEQDRAHSSKGLKDRIDIISILLNYSFDFKEYVGILKKYAIMDYKRHLFDIINLFKDFSYFNLNPRQYKLKKLQLLELLKKA